LVARGLVTRQHGQADRRVVWVTLAPTGQQLVGQVMTKRREMLGELLADLSLDDRESFARGAERLALVAGEVPERQWWAQWERSTQHHPETVPSPSGGRR
jgi:hypothetical protein